MKYLIITLLAFCSVNCSHRADEHDSVFLQNFKDKPELLRHGYTTPKVRGLRDTIFFDAPFRKFFIEDEKARVANLLSKQIGDTNVCYKMRNGEVDAISIYIPFKRADTAKLFALLDTLGFQRTIKNDGHHSLFVNAKAGLSYIMDVNSWHVQFENDFGDPVKHTPVPPMDSTAQVPKH
jgi:hypothetical protein